MAEGFLRHMAKEAGVEIEVESEREFIHRKSTEQRRQ
jgi:hypothetical protein